MFGQHQLAQPRNSARARSPPAQATPGCVPFNFFGGAGSITPAMMDYVDLHPARQQQAANWDFSANITGDLVRLPGGPLGVAVGVEYRKLSGSFNPDPVVAAGFSSDIPAAARPAAATMSKEAYAELNAPVLKRTTDGEFARSSMWRARISDYSTLGLGHARPSRAA